MSNPVEEANLRTGNFAEKLIEGVQIGSTAINTFRSVFNSLANIPSKAYDFYTKMQSFLDDLYSISVCLSEAIKNINIPTITEKQKEELRKNHEQWGKFGWTWFPNAPLNFFDIPPLNYADANNKVKSFCSTQAIENLFNNLRQRNVNKADLESAIFCYHNKQYKACSLLLFGLIDAKMIRAQPKGGNWRKTGDRAVKLLNNQLEEKR